MLVTVDNSGLMVTAVRYPADLAPTITRQEIFKREEKSDWNRNQAMKTVMLLA